MPSRQMVFSSSPAWPAALSCTHSFDSAGRVAGWDARKLTVACDRIWPVA